MASGNDVTISNDHDLAPQRLTWAALLGRWVDFARSALALPDDPDGRRLRACVPDIIMLQAVWCALRELDDLEGAERALGLDRAAVLIDKHAAAIEQRWPDPAEGEVGGGETMPQLLLDLIRDAREELAAKQQGT